VAIVKTGELVAPSGTMTDAGTVTLGSLLLRATLTPPAAAAPFRITRLLPFSVTPPTTEAGDKVMAESVTGTTVSVALLPAPPTDAVMLAVILALTTDVLMVNKAEVVEPPGTVTLGSTDTAGLLLASETTSPPAGAGPLIVTLLAVVDAPPATVDGDNETANTDGGATVSLPVFVKPL